MTAPPGVASPLPAVSITSSATAPPNSLSTTPTEESSSGGSPVVIGAAAAGGAAAVLAAALVGFCLYRRRKRNRNQNFGPIPLAPKAGSPNESGPFDQPPSTSSGGSRFSGVPPSQRYFSLDELWAATNGWSEANMVGSGSFGTVYRGMLPDRTIVAIKRLDQRRRGRGSAVEERSWNAELAALSKVRHKNLVHFIGACNEADERLLVFEFVSGGSLDQRLRSARESGIPFLSWTERMAVIQGVCRGLAYLHHDISPPLLHRDIKASNILLKGGGSNVAPRGGGSDENIMGGSSNTVYEGGGRLEACIADFGLAHLMEDAESGRDTTSAVKGTLPYMAPEYLQGGSQFLSTKCDVYSFGVLTLELLSGRVVTARAPDARARFEPLPARAARLVAEGRGLAFIDVAVWDAFRVREADCCLQTALECLRGDPSARPTMEQISLRLRLLAPEMGGSEPPLLSGEESASTIWPRSSVEGSSSGQLSSAAWDSLPSHSMTQAVPFQFLDGR
ncbi:Protein kinase superfamily protein [Klebsormidium nitens]|uniref:Protein kinase superfamily protein n=1 Tax=Klebsormidium nitens TaxID=105231 RepID=A0A1Y1ID84_KLENI|nr:Protein kinase superfamily protein [Klebsormidium nitens]|eukprot:GAQ86687.1 Protein kinase superfamily protein [Klebsormidium nitens]